MTRLARSVVTSLLIAATCTAPAGIARAAPPTAPAPDHAAARKAQGDTAMDEHRFADALKAYEDAYAESPNPAVLFNLARAHEALDQLPEALATFERFKAEAPPDLLARVAGIDGVIDRLRARVAMVEIKCNVAGARVILANKVIGTTPLAPLRIVGGPASIEVAADGYVSFKRDLDLPGGRTTVIDAALVAVPRRAVLVVKSTIAGTLAHIDDTPYGAAPVEALVDRGSHKIRVSHDGYNDTETTIVVTAGERKEITVDPLKSAPITAKWWFWTGVGVVVLTGVGIAIAATTEKPAGSGDFSPGKVSAPLLRF